MMYEVRRVYAHVAVLCSVANILASKYNDYTQNHLCLDAVGISEQASTIWPVSMISIANELTRQPISESCCHGSLQTSAFEKLGDWRREPRFTRLNRSILYVAIPSQKPERRESGITGFRTLKHRLTTCHVTRAQTKRSHRGV